MSGRRLALCVAAILMASTVAACATPSPPVIARTAGKAQPAAEVAVTRDGDVWTADYVFADDAPVWGFERSTVIEGTREPWRPRDWQVTTPGVVLERVGDLDVLRSLDGRPVPRRVSLRLTPSSDDLEADYSILKFTDGSVAMYSGAFDVFPLPSLEAIPETMERGTEREWGAVRITWTDRAGPVLVKGERLAQATAQDANAYVLFGKAQMKESDRLVTVVDPELPAWLVATIEDFAPRVIDYYGQRLGPGETRRPTIMASWYGPNPTHTSLSGSVLPGLITASFEGRELLTEAPDILARNRWFIGHEGAHFWLGQTVRYERARDSWITEGGADLMAVRALKTLDPTYDARAELQLEVDDCVKLGTRPVSEAGRRGEHRAFYACGAVFALAAEAAQKRATGGDWFDFLKPLIDDSREDGVLTREEWLAHLTAVSGDPELRAQIEVLLDTGAADPTPIIVSLFERSGVAYRLTDGKIELI